MRTPTHFFATVLALVLTAACTNDAASPPDDFGSGPLPSSTVVVNAAVYTVDTERPWADAFAFDADGIIIAVGDEASVRSTAGEQAVVVDLGGAMVLPGFQDVHVHAPEAGINSELCYLPGSDLGDLERRARNCAEQQAEADWVRAAGASLFELRDSTELPIDVLDRALPDRPALILDDLGHAAWTNSLGLEAAGISEDDPDPQGGLFHRDPNTGRLTGLLLESAQQLVRNAASLDAEANYQGLLASLEELNRNGVTAVSDAGGYWGQQHPEAWTRAANEGTLTVRASNSLYVYPDLDVDTQLREFEARFSSDSDLLRFDTAKVYVDGILDLGTALLLEPYDTPVDPVYPSGFRYFAPEQLRIYVNELHQLGYRINFHVIGDAAVREALDSVAAIDDDPDSIAERRHRTTHTYLVDPADIDRFAELGVIADFQLNPGATDPLYHLDLTDIIGDRAFALIPVSDLSDAGAVTLSSDWDAGPLPPLGTLQRAIIRTDQAPTELATAIAAHTIDAAYALGHDDTTGSITVGKFADFVVIDQNLFEIDPEAIDQIRILATFLSGEAVYTTPR